MIDEKINAIRSNEVGNSSLAALRENSVIIQSMLRPDLSYQISDSGEVLSTLWAVTDEDLWADTRRHISKGEIARMAATSWNDDTRLDWLLKLAQASGLSLDLLEAYTRPLFDNIEPAIPTEKAA